MATWINAFGGDWSVASNWSGNAVPSDSAELGALGSGAYEVDVTNFEIEFVGTLTIDSADATLNVQAGGLLHVGTLQFSSGILKVEGRLTVSASGIGSGELDLSGPLAEIDFGTLALEGNANDAGLQINVTNSDLSDFADLDVTQNSTLTIGAHTHLDLAGTGADRILGLNAGLVNNGTITSEAAKVSVNVLTFTNAGTLSVSGGSDMKMVGSIFGNGLIDLSSGAELELGAAAAGGTIHFGSGGATLKVDSATLPADTISGFAAGDVIELGAHAFNGLDSVTLLANNVLDLTPAAGGGPDMTLQLAQSEDFSGRRFFLSQGPGNDTQIRVASTVTVTTPVGIDLRWATLYSEFANCSIQPGGTATQCTLTDAAAGIKFVFTGTGFTYGSSPLQFTGGTITSFQIQDNSSNVLATFGGLSFSATTFQSAVVNYVVHANAAGLNAIFLTNSYLETGAAGIDKFQGGNLFDDFIAGTGNDVVDGGLGINTAVYSGLASPGLVASIHSGAGTVNKGGSNGIDTLTNSQNIIGTTASDVFKIDANETVFGGGGFDYLIELSPNVNLAYGNSFTGISEFVSNTGTNTLDFSLDPNFAYVYGSSGQDTLTLGSGGGYLFSGGGTLNVLTGGTNASNFLVDGGGTATMTGGGGSASNYFYVSGGTNDTVHGAGAFNTVIQLTAGVTVQLGSANFQNVNEYVANSGTNTVTVAGDTGFKYLYGGAGSDTLVTGSGGGYLFGEGGTNMLNGGGGTNVFIADGAAGIDTMNGGSGSNLYYIDANSIVHGAGTFNNVIELQQNASLTLGSAQLGTDVQQVIFNGGTNSADFHTATTQVFLYGAAGNDTLFGGSASDFLYGGLGTNTFTFAAGWGKDTIEDWTAGTNDIIDLTGLSSLGVHAITDLTQTITAGKDVITSSHTGTNSITLLGVGSALTASSFHFA